MTTNTSRPGKFIVFEGMDASGKSTAVELMQEILQDLKIPVCTLRVPGGTDVGEKLRDILLSGDSKLEPETEFLLMQATRIEAYNKIIKQAVSRGQWVICDRFCTSSYAYQYAAKGVDRRLVGDVIYYTTPESEIDCSIYIRRPFDDIIAHIDTKEKDHFESMKKETLLRIYNEYEYRTTDAFETWITINNDQSLSELKAKLTDAVTLIESGECSGEVL